MIVVDSSGWLEFLTDGPLGEEYAKRLRQPSAVITPTIILYEVYKHAKRLRGEEGGLEAVAAMQKTVIVPLNDDLALVAADLSMPATNLAAALSPSHPRALGPSIAAGEASLSNTRGGQASESIVSPTVGIIPV